MDYAYGQSNGKPAVTLSGRFVYADAGKIHDIIAKWDFSTSPTMTLDLKFVTFIDSTAIGTLFVAANRTEEAGGELVLRNPPQSVLKALARAELPSRARIVME